MVERREQLARRRAAMGFTQETLAVHLEMERSAIARWEQGTGTPQPRNRPALAAALDVSREELNHLLDGAPPCQPADRVQLLDAARSVVTELTWPDWHPAGQADVVDPPWSLTGTRQVLHQIAGGPVDRR